MPSVRRRNVRRAVVLAENESASQCIGVLSAGVRITGLTMGQFSLLDLVAAVLEQIGSACVCISTWTTGIRDIQRAAWLLDNGVIEKFTLLTDRSFPQRQPEYCAALLARFGETSVRSTRTHAKFAILTNDVWRVVIRSSMNLNSNPRYEQFDLDDDAELADWFLRHVDEQVIGFDEAAVSACWASRDNCVESPREKARRKIAERKAKKILERHGVQQ